MALAGLDTLPDHRQARRARRARNVRRVGLAVLWAVIIAGAVGLLGSRTGQVRDDRPGVSLRVDYPAVTRAGVAAGYRVEVVRPGGFAGQPVTVAVDRSMFERFDYQNFYPNPSAETADATMVTYEFDPPEGDVFTWVSDVRTSPEQNGSIDRYTTRLLERNVVVAEVSFTIYVMP
jgi:hypothetical protein